MVEELCGVPVVGVLPYFKNIFIEEEDSVSLEKKFTMAVADKVNVAVIRVNRMSNFTDFDRLEKDPRVNLFYTDQPTEIAKADIVVLPGSKNTIEDLIHIKNNGVAQAIYEAYKREKTIIGVCGGYQMMGEVVEDPHGVESSIAQASGLGLLPVRTVLQSEKTTQQRNFTYRNYPEPCRGYEIHMGLSTPTTAESPVNYFTDGRTDGYFLNKKCWGTYLHGVLDNSAVVNDILSDYTSVSEEAFNYQQYKEEQYDKLAAVIREHVDMDQVYRSLII